MGRAPQVSDAIVVAAIVSKCSHSNWSRNKWDQSKRSHGKSSPGPRTSGKARAVALEERFARRLRESCDDAVAAARRFEVRSVAVHQYVRDEVTIE